MCQRKTMCILYFVERSFALNDRALGIAKQAFVHSGSVNVSCWKHCLDEQRLGRVTRRLPRRKKTIFVGHIVFACVWFFTL